MFTDLSKSLVLFRGWILKKERENPKLNRTGTKNNEELAGKK